VHRLTRRAALRASAGAAAAVPLVALGGTEANAASNRELRQRWLRRLRRREWRRDLEVIERAGDEPAMVVVHDVQRGKVSILRGTKEHVVRNRRLVAQILRARHG
jgi:hypothetical protein